MEEKLTFEKANEKLEILVNKMESGDLSLDESMKCYEEAFKLLGYCYKQLEVCKGQITDINKRIDDIKNKEDIFNE
ncbi:MAG: exodeoxyribonuclease VII small subunit [Ruminococcus sp.]|nr:exodeoxyribonuclease VII small subunit [Ruminococcus sp.]